MIEHNCKVKFDGNDANTYHINHELIYIQLRQNLIAFSISIYIYEKRETIIFNEKLWDSKPDSDTKC